MGKLTFQDSTFLRLESERRPFHVAGLMIFKPPADMPRGYMGRLARDCGRLNEIWPILNQRLSDPDDLGRARWVEAGDYDPARHVLHYALRPGGRMDDLLQLVTAVHERKLDRGRPLWEIHIIEGLPGNKFALYCKVHHALVDGVGALQMVDAIFSTSPTRRFRPAPALTAETSRARRLDIGRRMRELVEQARHQSAAMPEILMLLAHMSRDALRGDGSGMTLPFTAPQSIFNRDVDSRRCIATCDLPLGQVRAIARAYGGTVNDVLLAVCGGALRHYLGAQKALPKKSLVAGLPVSLKHAGETQGNRLSFILCPFFTEESSPRRRLQRVIRSTSRAKTELSRMTPAASQDFANMLLMPTVLLTLTGNVSRVNPAINAIFSNVPGSRQRLYLQGSELQALYPLSVVTDGMGINITVISYVNKLCFAVTSCPTEQPNINAIGKLLQQSFAELKHACRSR
tara:strand:- start:1001 stop:2374 length:1374 start_codon:yes stop_codon:yes gene_type:complete